MNFFIEGFVLQAGLILGLGAQNLFVLDVGIRRNRHQLIAAVCALCDLILIAVGVLGAASLFIAYPKLKIIFGILGVFFLAYYAVLKLIEACRSKVTALEHESRVFTSSKAIMAALAFSLLNPHVYLDTVVLIGGYATKHESLMSRAQFGAGAGTFSIIWFFALANLSALLGPLLVRPKVMRIVSLVAGLVLSWLSYKLGSQVWGWLKNF